VLTDLGRLDAALESYEAALAASPDHPHALNGAARAALALCDWAAHRGIQAGSLRRRSRRGVR